MNRNRDTIEKINKGHQKIVRALYDGDFPIRENARQGYTLKPVETISGPLKYVSPGPLRRAGGYIL